jgi:hypothetical protein
VLQDFFGVKRILAAIVIVEIFKIADNARGGLSRK